MAFGSFNQDSAPSQMSDINMVPLIDVMLVLLIVFMITAPLLSHSVQIELPVASSETSNDEPDSVALSIDGDGVYYWDDEVVTEAELHTRLDDIARQEPQPALNLRADRDTRYQTLAEVLTAARQAGVRQIGFVTTPD